MSVISSNYTSYSSQSYNSSASTMKLIQLPNGKIANLDTRYLGPGGDIYIPGTEGKNYEKFTVYHLSPGKSFHSLGGDFEPTYFALTMVVTDANTSNDDISQNNNSKKLTLSEIDPNKPAAVFHDGKYTLVETFLKEHSVSQQTDKTAANQTTDEKPDEQVSDSYAYELTDDRFVIRSAQQITKVEDVNALQQVDHYAPLLPSEKKQLAVNPGLIWKFAPEQSAFKSHDILNGIFDKIFTDVKTLQLITDEYGFQYQVPGRYDIENVPGQPVHIGGIGSGGSPVQITSQDKLSSDFGGLTLEERDVFWSEVQKILDRYGIKVDARKEEYGCTPSDMPGCNTEFVEKGYWTWGNDTVSSDKVRAINKEIYDNEVISALFIKNEKVLKGEIPDDTLAQQYSIRVTDKDGNALAKDQIIIESKNGNQLQMSVSDFVKLGRKEITTMLM